MSKKSYIVLPGMVNSQYDADRHYITADELINLYEVDRDDCIIISKSGKEWRGMPKGVYTVLEPRNDGKYFVYKCYKTLI